MERKLKYETNHKDLNYDVIVILVYGSNDWQASFQVN